MEYKNPKQFLELLLGIKEYYPKREEYLCNAAISFLGLRGNSYMLKGYFSNKQPDFYKWILEETRKSLNYYEGEYVNVCWGMPWRWTKKTKIKKLKDKILELQKIVNHDINQKEE